LTYLEQVSSWLSEITWSRYNEKIWIIGSYSYFLITVLVSPAAAVKGDYTVNQVDANTTYSSNTVTNNWLEFQKDSSNTGYSFSSAPTSDPKLLWKNLTSSKQKPLGSGGINVPPVIFGNKVFVTAGNASVWAFNKDTGSLIWSKELGGGLVQTATPALGDGKLFVPTHEGDIYAFNPETGAKLWKTHVTDSSFECPITYYDHKLYIGDGLKGGNDTKYYYCYDDNGNLIWKHENTNTSGFIWSGATVVGNYLVYPVFEGKLICLEKDTGTFVDKVDFSNSSDVSFALADPGMFRSSVTYANGALYTSSERGQEKGYCFKVGFNKESGRFLDSGWATSIGFSTSTPVVYNGRVYVGHGEHGESGSMFCLNDSDGAVIWETPVSGGVKSSPVVSVKNGKPYIYFTEAIVDGSIYCLNSNGTLAWKYNPPADTAYTLQGAALSDGKVYYGTDNGYLYCIGYKEQENYSIPEDSWFQFHGKIDHLGYSKSGPKSNRTEWASKDIDAINSSSPVIAEGKVFVICGSGGGTEGTKSTAKLVALNEFTGNIVWNTKIPETVYDSWASPAYDNGMVFTATGPELGCYNAKTGEKIWSFRNTHGTAGVVNSGPAIADGMVIFNDWDGSRYYCLDEYTGDLLWNFKVKGDAQSVPTYADGKFYLTSYEYGSSGNIYCVDAITGKQVWKNSNIVNSLCGSPVYKNGIIYLTTYSFYGKGELLAINAGNGKKIWEQAIESSDSTPAFAYGNVYVCGGTKGYTNVKTYCFNATTGSPV
jgi:outer membrane protein assembly factor BamB